MERFSFNFFFFFTWFWFVQQGKTTCSQYIMQHKDKENKTTKKKKKNTNKVMLQYRPGDFILFHIPFASSLAMEQFPYNVEAHIYAHMHRSSYISICMYVQTCMADNHRNAYRLWIQFMKCTRMHMCVCVMHIRLFSAYVCMFLWSHIYICTFLHIHICAYICMYVYCCMISFPICMYGFYFIV